MVGQRIPALRGYGDAMIQQEGRSGHGLLQDATAIAAQIENDARSLAFPRRSCPVTMRWS